MDESPIYPVIWIGLSTDDLESIESDTTLLTIRTRVPNSVMEQTDFVGDLFKEMFDGRA